MHLGPRASVPITVVPFRDSYTLGISVEVDGKMGGGHGD